MQFWQLFTKEKLIQRNKDSEKDGGYHPFAVFLLC